MLSCWRLKPELRPSFGELEDELYKLLERNTANRFISLNESYQQWNTRHFNPYQPDYLKLVKSPDIPRQKPKPKPTPSPKIANKTLANKLTPGFPGEYVVMMPALSDSCIAANRPTVHREPTQTMIDQIIPGEYVPMSSMTDLGDLCWN